MIDLARILMISYAGSIVQLALRDWVDFKNARAVWTDPQIARLTPFDLGPSLGWFLFRRTWDVVALGLSFWVMVSL